MRYRLIQKPGVLGNLLAAIGGKKGFIGEIRTIRMGSETVVRDIVVFADNLSHMDQLIQTVEDFPDAELLEVCDEVLERLYPHIHSSASIHISY